MNRSAPVGTGEPVILKLTFDRDSKRYLVYLQPPVSDAAPAILYLPKGYVDQLGANVVIEVTIIGKPSEG